MTIKNLTNTFDGAYQMNGGDFSALRIKPDNCNICIINDDEVLYHIELNEVRHVCDDYNYYEGLFIDGNGVKFARAKWCDLCNLEIDSFNLNLNAGKFNFYISYGNYVNFMFSDKFFRFDERLIKFYNK